MEMTPEKLHELLTDELCACQEAITWLRGKSLSVAWASCDRADWMLWLAGRMVGRPGWWTRQQVVLAACACAETVLELFEKKYPEDKRPRKAIEIARHWVAGKATMEEVRVAAAAADAYAAAYAYAAADAAAYAAAAAAAAAAAYAAAAADADAAAAAAADADAAAYAYAAAAAYRVILSNKRKALAYLVRKELPLAWERRQDDK